MRELWRRIEALFRRRSLDRDLGEELQFHLDMKTRETGNPVAARRTLGSPLLLREHAREAWGWRWIDEGSGTFATHCGSSGSIPASRQSPSRCWHSGLESTGRSSH